MIRTHPATGRRNLYIGRHASHIVGEDHDESRKLLEELCVEACRPPRIHIHKWQVGDLVIWDNRCVLHRGLGHPPDQAAPDGADHRRGRQRRGQRVGSVRPDVQLWRL